MPIWILHPMKIKCFRIFLNGGAFYVCQMAMFLKLGV